MNNKTKFLKFGIAVLLGAGAAGLLYAQLNIPTDIDNAVITIKQVNVVDNANNAVITLNGSGGTQVTVKGAMVVGDTATNTVSGSRSAVYGGDRNNLTGSQSVIAGGRMNKINGSNSMIPGGSDNTVNASYGFAAGRYATINHQGTFIWSDSQGIPFQSTKTNQFLIRAQNGVGINTGNTATGYDLTVSGSGIFYGNLKTNNMIAGAYYYGSITNEDDLYELKLSQWEGTGNIYYNSGYVGIGIASPTAQLHVNGTTRLQGLATSTQNTALVIDTNGNVGTRALNTIAFDGYTAPVTSVAGRVGVVVLTKTDVGLASVDNTTDMAKPVSTATQTALNLKANLANPALTGIPTAPTAPVATSTTQIATTEFVKLQGYLTTATAPVTSVAGKVGAVLLTKTDVGLASVDNTTDIAKPVSTATQTELNLKANLASPGLTGIPTAPTASAATDSVQIATTAFVKDQGYLTTATESDPEVGILTTGKRCIAANGKVNCLADSPIISESDPKIGTLTSGKMCTTNGTIVTCTTDIPTTPTNYVTTDTPQTVVGAKTFSNNITISPNTSNRIYMGGTTNGDFGIAFSSAYPDYGIFYTEGSPDYVSISPNGSRTNPVMKIDGNGSVGIGTPTPTAKLDVNGTTNFSGNISSNSIKTELGSNTNAYGIYSIAMGRNTVADGDTATAMGRNTYAKGIHSTAMGFGTTASGNYSTAMGFVTNANGDGSTAMGGATKAVGNYSTAMGTATIANGDNSTAMGRATVANGASSTVIGTYNVGLTTSLFEIGNGTNVTRSNALTVLADGSVGIGTSTPATKLDVEGRLRVGQEGIAGSYGNGTDHTKIQGIRSIGNSRGINKTTNTFGTLYGMAYSYEGYGGIAGRGHQISFHDNGIRNATISLSNGNAYFNGSVTALAFYYSSDITLKKDLTKITNPLEKIIALNGYNFTWKSDDTKDIGVVAQEVEKVFPEAVKTDDKGLKSVKYGNLIAPVIEAIKELYTKYLDQQTQISELEQRIEILEKNIIK